MEIGDIGSHSLSVSPLLHVKTRVGGCYPKSGCQSPLWLDIVAPAKCALCDARGNPLCADCWLKLNPGWKIEDNLAYLGRHEGLWKDLVGMWKFGGRSDLPDEIISQCGVPTIINHTTALIPAPQSRWRFASRGYNQSADLAWALARSTGCTVVDCLREPWRRSQSHLSASRSERLVKKAVTVELRKIAELGSGKVVLVDDVTTTGGTLRDLSRVLRVVGVHVSAAVVVTKTPRYFP